MSDRRTRATHRSPACSPRAAASLAASGAALVLAGPAGCADVDDPAAPEPVTRQIHTVQARAAEPPGLAPFRAGA